MNKASEIFGLAERRALSFQISARQDLPTIPMMIITKLQSGFTARSVGSESRLKPELKDSQQGFTIYHLENNSDA